MFIRPATSPYWGPGSENPTNVLHLWGSWYIMNTYNAVPPPTAASHRGSSGCCRLGCGPGDDGYEHSRCSGEFRGHRTVCHLNEQLVVQRIHHSIRVKWELVMQHTSASQPKTIINVTCDTEMFLRLYSNNTARSLKLYEKCPPDVQMLLPPCFHWHCIVIHQRTNVKVHSIKRRQ